MTLSPLLSLYMVRHFLGMAVLVLLMVVGLILVADIIELIRRASGREEVGFATVLMMAGLKMPHLLHTVLPFIMMLAAMGLFWKLGRSAELVAVRAVGVSVWEFLAPLLGVTLLLGVLNIMILNPLAATMFAEYQRMEDRLLETNAKPLTLSNSGLWLREATEVKGQAVVHARGVRQEAFDLYLRDVTVMDLDTEGVLTRTVRADEAVLAEDRFLMRSVWIHTPGEPSAYYEVLERPTTLTLGQVQENFASPDTLSFWELPEFIAFYERSGFSAHRHRLHWQALWASPVLLCAMVLVAAAFSVKINQRRGGIMMRITGGVLAGFLVYFFSQLTFALGLSSTIPLALAAWSPALVTLLLSATMLLHQEDG